ncbi:lipopolysaccharide core heptose(II) kinase RfaY [uncultured Cetobacterium sp.]|uniref:lipopolysaccharide core heptose(II) kinase RfaY n=1 Tax=uncultured Cetobacterium sp. TaxID=527638 RepID=UPI00263374AC|nr:lipopolysaccharide core heptose(II) kinase RfaY [uncultured Cetobacterium sp.]
MEKLYCQEQKNKVIYERIKSNSFKLLKTLKDDERSKVLLIEIDSKKLVYKIPIEKNERVWQRILSIFRGSESAREYKNYIKISKLGFKGPSPLIYWEHKKCGVIVDSFLVMEYLEGETANLLDLELVVEELNKIHKKGYLHGDSQLSNFMVKNLEVYLIDVKLSKNIYLKLGEKYEFIYLEESCHKMIDVYDKTDWSYKLAKSLNSYLHWLGKIKKKLRRKDK